MPSNLRFSLDFLKSRNTGLKQESADWVRTRQDTIGASEISALFGSSPYETPKSLLQKKIQPTDMHNNVACTWGNLFEPFVRSYFEQKHSVSVFIVFLLILQAGTHFFEK